MAFQSSSERMLRELSQLVAIPTENPPGQEAAAAAFIRDILAPAGFEVRLDEYKPGRFNVEARLSNGPGPVFALNTHIDTVPAGSGWTSDPFVLSERDGKLFGRGACDCKGPLIAMLEALRLLASDRAGWSGTLLGVFTGDEEIASEGARHYAAGRPAIDAVVVGEPTGNTTFSAHKGSLRPWVRVEGLSAHSGSPHLGKNAIFLAGVLMPVFEAFHRDVLSGRNHPLVGSPSLTVTRIKGGTSDNVVPDACDLLVDRRLIPGETEAEALAEISALLQQAQDMHGIRAFILGQNATTGGATETDVTAPIVAASLAACSAAGLAKPGPFGFQGACDLVHFVDAGAQGTVIGPGDLGVAHKPDEFVPKDEFLVSASIYADVARRMLAA
ncbi:hypothetical protein P775_12950 [Puniceibacterium antarcticum]|uniref:Peptidase M20 dimerisation domain-containing protein n=1 Tax=Puniceibacterium antarcticum TaxID=1206336 RepID=A0A2G8RE44_9RHOB|nr:M20 family metallopeptidase [Puniceibacterium antarcticum]PIL19753.1 hypothetical protein P775_12950 [Puniceibacterium antarcticum]